MCVSFRHISDHLDGAPEKGGGQAGQTDPSASRDCVPRSSVESTFVLCIRLHCWVKDSEHDPHGANTVLDQGRATELGAKVHHGSEDRMVAH